MAYKNCIRLNQKTEKETISNNLHDALINKSKDSFWKMWNSKFGVKKRLANQIDGLYDDQSISNHVAEYFAKSCSVNSMTYNSALFETFKRPWSCYVGEASFKVGTIDVQMIGVIIENMSL